MSSNRLEGLTKKPPAKGLKFKPKVVARKSKEERDREAPRVKEEPQDPVIKRGATAGRGRGGRRNQYAGTHMVSLGPLLLGSVAMGNASGTKLGFTLDQTFNSVSPTPEFLLNLRLKERPPKAEGEDAYSDDEDPTKINMTKDYAFADEETVLFPVRPTRAAGARTGVETGLLVALTRESTATPKEETPVKGEKEDEGVVREVETVKSEEPENTPIKSEEPIEVKIDKIKAHKDALESKMEMASDTIETEEANKLLTDHAQLLRTITDKLADVDLADQYMMFQMPRKLPRYSAAGEEVAVPTGQIGRINIHQSGKISIDLGNDNTLAVQKGTSASFLQELVALEMHERGEDDMDVLDELGRAVRGDYARLGMVVDKLIATPLI